MYLTAGYPDVPTTRRWARVLAEAGATSLELGVPFSDPIGDGPTIQRASQQRLASGMSLRGSLDLAAAIGRSVTAPVVLMSYCNPILRMGARAFAERAAAAGVTGVIVPDLPIEEAADLKAQLGGPRCTSFTCSHPHPRRSASRAPPLRLPALSTVWR